MHLIRLSFLLLQFLGFWRPTNWENGWKSWLYYIYTEFSIFVLCAATIPQIINLMLTINDDVEAFTTNSMILLTIVSACTKCANVLNMRKQILKLFSILENNPCKPRNDIELRIQEKYEQTIRSKTLFYGALIESSVIGTSMSQIINGMSGTLPFAAWLPYSTDNSTIAFWITASLQVASNPIGSLVHVSYDTLISGCMIHVCVQLEILKNRLIDFERLTKKFSSNDSYKDQIAEESILIADCVKHHLQIFNFATEANYIFSYPIFIQYSVSMIELCLSVYQLSTKVPGSQDFFLTFAYMCCMLIQIFLYCFHGEGVTHESLDLCNHIYAIDWVPLSMPTKKSLMTIMTRSLKPIVFTSGHFVVLSLESFSRVIKLSYSAYNVLVSTS